MNLDNSYFKILDGVQATHGGSHRYPGVGRWTRHINDEPLEACAIGYHLAHGPQLLDWLGPTIYLAEPCQLHEPMDAGNKWVTCRVRLVERFDTWNDRTARLLAADCAESALFGERAVGREPDERSWAAVEAARQYANGEIGDAARDAAWDAARAAAWDAAWAAARDAARAAAWDAARAAARAAAWDAAWDAARAAARAAARDAARDAAWDRLSLYLLDRPIPPVEPLYGKVTA